MAVLQKIRVKFGLAISIIIALALLSFIIDPSTLEGALHNMSSKYDVGQIAGKKVSYTDFQEDIDKFTTINQIMTGSTVQNEQTQQQIRNAAWQDLLDRYMFVENAKNAGIRVGDDELVDLTTGSRVSPVLSQNPSFIGEDGQFSAENVRNFVKNIEVDKSGQLKTYWNYLQNTIYNQQYYVKYGALFNTANIFNPLMEAAAIAENNTTSNIEYVVAPYDYNDSTITVSSNEIQAYYKNHKDRYEQQASRDIEYVVFEVVPSDTDIQKTSDEMESLLPGFDETDNMKAFLLKNSERGYSEYWYKNGDLNTVSSEINDYAFSGAQGASPVFKDGNTFRSVKVMESAMVPDSAYVKHILLQGADAAVKADSLLNVGKNGENFSNLVALYSADKNSAADGELGNIGWMSQSYMIPGFESVLTAETGKPFILKTQYGSHVVMVTKKTAPVAKKRVAILEKTSLASKETFNDFYAQANKFATLTAGTYEGYKKALDTTKVYSHPMNRVTEATSSYGSVDQAKEVTRWIFDNKKGKASNIITVNNNFFFVVALKDIHKEGYAPVADVAPTIKDQLYFEKLQAKTKADMAAKTEGKSLEEIAQMFNSTVVTRDNVAFSSVNGPSVEPALVGAASVAPEGKVCGPVAGQMGVYFFKVDARNTGSFYTAEDAKNFEAQKTQYAAQLIIPVMMKNADVKDNRARFF